MRGNKKRRSGQQRRASPDSLCPNVDIFEEKNYNKFNGRFGNPAASFSGPPLERFAKML